MANKSGTNKQATIIIIFFNVGVDYFMKCTYCNVSFCRSIRSHVKSVLALDFAPNGHHLASGRYFVLRVVSILVVVT